VLCVALGDGVRLTFRSKTRRFCCSSSGVEDIGGGTGREKLDPAGTMMGILPTRGYTLMSTGSFGDETMRVGTDENEDGSCCA